MLFRPNFCANCGVKVERPEWFPWTSRRFCVVCEIEFKGQDLIPRVVVLAGIVIGLFGFGSYISSGEKRPDLLSLKQQSKTHEKHAELKQDTFPVPTSPVSRLANPVNGQPESRNLSSISGTNPPQPRLKVEKEEPVSFCGAETKKGTPCSRRVKGAVRCYQHVGMPTMTVSQGPVQRGQK